jgi:hypothetical protein
LAAEKVEALEERIHELVELKEWLASTVDVWQRRLEHTPAGKRAGLLDSLREGLSAGPNQAAKGRTNENARPHHRPMPGRRSKSSNGDGKPDA